MLVRSGDCLNADSLISKQHQKLLEIIISSVWLFAKFSGKPSLRGQYLGRVEACTGTRKFELTTLFEKFVSPGLAVRLMAENVRIISMNAFSGADSARSTRFWAIAASMAGSAALIRCKSIDMVKRVTCRAF